MEIILSLMKYKKEKSNQNFIELINEFKKKSNSWISKFNYLGVDEVYIALYETIFLVTQKFEFINVSLLEDIKDSKSNYLDKYIEEYILNNKYVKYIEYDNFDLYYLFSNENMFIKKVKFEFLNNIKCLLKNENYLEIDEFEIPYEIPKERFKVREILIEKGIFDNISFTNRELEVLNFILDVNELVPENILATSFNVSRQCIGKIKNKAFEKIRKYNK